MSSNKHVAFCDILGFSHAVEVRLSAWAARFKDGLFAAPLLHFDGHHVVNLFAPVRERFD